MSLPTQVLFLVSSNHLGAIQKGRHRGGEGGRQDKLVTNGDKGGREVECNSDIPTSENSISFFLFLPVSGNQTYLANNVMYSSKGCVIYIYIIV